jgi:hypothetical protein
MDIPPTNPALTLLPDPPRADRESRPGQCALWCDDATCAGECAEAPHSTHCECPACHTWRRAGCPDDVAPRVARPARYRFGGLAIPRASRRSDDTAARLAALEAAVRAQTRAIESLADAVMAIANRLPTTPRQE